LSANLKNVAKTGCRDQSGAHTLAFEYGIGCDGRAMNQRIEVPGYAKIGQTLKYGPCGVARCGKDFVNPDFAVLEEDEIGKGASGINPDE